MKNKDFVRLAREAGILVCQADPLSEDGNKWYVQQHIPLNVLLKLVELVEQEENEKCAVDCENHGEEYSFQCAQIIRFRMHGLRTAYKKD